MTILSDKDIKEEREKGNIIIEPFNERNLGNCSYDVTLGPNYYEWNKEYDKETFCPWLPEDVAKFWKPKSATDCGVILIRPRETILAHTNEFIGGIGNITTKMQARSSLGRCCVSVCKCAGYGDIGYTSKWTMEIENAGPVPLTLIVGQRIAQIIFIRTGEVEKSYSVNGSYQTTDDFEEIKRTWTPEMMLPKLKYDS